MTERLYYYDSFLYYFDARVIESQQHSGRYALVLDRTAFYPTSGGQVHDTGMLILADKKEVAVIEVADEDDGRIFHLAAEPIAVGTEIHGSIDAARRCDHMQQHSGQHVLSAAFVRLFDMPTVSFHMGAESCTIDLQTASLTAAQVEQAERLANEVVLEDRPVAIRFVPLEEARQLGLRKLPPKQTGDLRLIDITDFDLTACGGTHVRSTGQIGSILLRKTEKVKQGMRVEFVCGQRTVTTARRDYATLTEAAGLLSTHIHELPQQVAKATEEARAAGKAQHKLLEELAGLYAERLLAQSHSVTAGSPRVITAVFPDRDAVFIKLLAQKLAPAETAVVALLACGGAQPALVFAQSPGQKSNMGLLMKETLAQIGGRGGGTAELAQGGIPIVAWDLASIEKLLQEIAAKL
jgi:alanyl-tRNA synthetase